LGIAAKRFLQ